MTGTCQSIDMAEEEEELVSEPSMVVPAEEIGREHILMEWERNYLPNDVAHLLWTTNSSAF